MSTPLARAFFVLGWLAIATGAVRPAEEKAKATPQEIKKLVENLGSPNKADVTRANKRLAEIGPAALAALRQAIAANQGQGLARAAESVVKQIARQEQKKLEGLLARRKSNRAIVYPIAAESVAQTFPAYLVLAVRFPQYPVAIRPRAPLKPQNLFIVDKNGELDQVTDFKGMEDFFRAHTGLVLKESKARQVARAWLAMSQELSQDGYFTFQKTVKAGQGKLGPKATGKATVKPEMGNKGAIEVTLTFDIDGSLDRVEETKHLRPGRRPKG